MNIFGFDVEQLGSFYFYMLLVGANLGLIFGLVRMLLLTFVERRSA